MRAVIQRVTRASVRVDGDVIGEIDGPGLAVLLGVAKGDGPEQVDVLIRKIAELRLLEGELSVEEAEAPVLMVSQFTLYGNTKKGRRPSWIAAAPGPEAEPLFQAVVEGLRARGLHVETGRFGAMMHVELVNDGPYTLIVEA